MAGLVHRSMGFVLEKYPSITISMSEDVHGIVNDSEGEVRRAREKPRFAQIEGLIALFVGYMDEPWYRPMHLAQCCLHGH